MKEYIFSKRIVLCLLVHTYLVPPALPTLNSVPVWFVGSPCEGSQRWSHSLQILDKKSLVKVNRVDIILMEVGPTCDNALPIFQESLGFPVTMPYNLIILGWSRQLRIWTWKGNAKCIWHVYLYAMQCKCSTRLVPEGTRPVQYWLQFQCQYSFKS